MAKADTTIWAGDLMKGAMLTVKLKGASMTRFRLWLTAQIIKLAACVGGFGGVVIQKSDDDQAGDSI
ncbi:hypothetical protein [Candidatus Magnetobacterium casense]|uniref:Uncharacterized protein n=1 Tax=Candidatus Magnetobacterium casense TaxID=1455061 RepID=A0ABS6S208_9BACT|nr:hypothetical protein [Candidatus Magnetobacterium casensis]MBV6342444.1 hypothetical protein [Candidatus Magnetobacterium casensis]